MIANDVTVSAVHTEAQQMEENWFTLTLVRHGETEANKSRIIQGQSDFKLNETGIEQARKLADYFKRNNQKFDHVFCSDLSRASVTCQLIVEPSEAITMEKRLRERFFSEFEGQSVEVYLKNAEKAGFSGKRVPKYSPKNVESDEDIQNRIVDFCNTVLLQSVTPNSNVLVVTHGGVVIEFMRFAQKSLSCDFNGQHAIRVPPNTGFSIFKISYNQSKLLKAVCESLHRTDHLKEKCEDKVGLSC